MQNIGKNIKSYATIPVHSPGKGREASWQKSKSFELNIVRLNCTHCFFVFKIMGKIFIFKVLFLANFQQIMQISHILPQNPMNHAKFAPFIDPLYINAFRFLTIGRELSEIPANRPDFAHFTHCSCKLHEICTIHTHGQ